MSLLSIPSINTYHIQPILTIYRISSYRCYSTVVIYDSTYLTQIIKVNELWSSKTQNSLVKLK